MGFKICCQIGGLGYDFQNYSMYVCFFIFLLKVRCFKQTVGQSCHTPFFQNFTASQGVGVKHSIHTHGWSEAFLNQRGNPRQLLNVRT